MAPTLKDLTDIRPQLVEGLEAYLKSFDDLSAWGATAPSFLFVPNRMSQEVAAVGLYQAPDVVNLKDLDEAKNRRRSELDARGEFGRGPDAPSTRPWATEREAPGCAVILGRPGEGKTLLTRLTCRDVARTSLELLRSRTVPVSDIPVPIWLRFEDVLTCTSLDTTHPHYDRNPLQAASNLVVSGMVADAVSQHFKTRNTPPVPVFAVDHIKKRLTHPSTWLFLDALDETEKAPSNADRWAALAALRALPPDIHVVMTCRKHEYSRDMLPHDLPIEVREYDLEPLSREQQQTFVSRWFGPGTAEARDVLALIGGHSQFQDMAANGLMLTLICATRERHTIGPDTRRVQLYHLMLRDMVSRARQPKPMPPNDPQIAKRLHVLREVAWSFFETQPGNTSLDTVNWTDRLIEQCDRKRIDPTALEVDIRREGLVVFHQKGSLRFLHRSFFEFLAGARMGRQGRREVVARMRVHAADQAWREALIMALGHLGLIQKAPEEAGAVVDEIVTRPPDSSGMAIALMGDAVVDSGHDCVLSGTLQRLRDALLRVMRDDGVKPKIRATAGSALGRLGDHRFHGEELWCLPKFQSDADAQGRLKPEPLLGFVEIPEGEFWMGSNTE